MLLIVLAGVSAAADRTQPEAAGAVPVLVTARDIPAGAVLAAADVRTALLPARAVPDGAMRTAAAVIGRALSGPQRRGVPLTDVALLGPEQAELSGGAGTVAVPIRVNQPGIAVLARPGVRVDVVAVDEAGQTTVVAYGAPVLAVEADPDGAEHGGTTLVVAVSEDLSMKLVAATLRDRLAATVRGQ